MNKILIILLISKLLTCQSFNDYQGLGTYAILNSSNSMFPDKERMDGHSYGGKEFPFREHYSDSSVFIFIPAKFKAGEQTDFVFYFHGWGNSIMQSLDEFQLVQQFVQSGRNAVFVFPEGPKNSSDSYGGKLEQENRFTQLIDDITVNLNKNRTPVKTIGNIALAGHSGAYRVIAFILNRGGLTDHIKQIILFDGFYGQYEKYAFWLDHYQGQFINIITPSGGTWDDSKDFLISLQQVGVAYKQINSNEFSKTDLERITFIFTDLKHSEVINPYFRMCLQNTLFNK
ncbi:MAG: hypothetical protein KDD94_14805 [Calditrichaeota bacterium]|nr:hypothetical protein [Calditrichota bacterium]